ncbi:MAG: sugar ABC transporter permease [Oscillospiraceae bacterium]|nr:sugar ABC transporter permease [Oscillospiraceae bacterium]
MNNKKRRRLLTPDDKTGLLFVLPFIIGFIFLFFKPLLESVNYTFHRISVDANGLLLEPIGFENWQYLVTKDSAFVKQISSIITSVTVEVLVIMFMSIFLAVLLVNKFPGRLLFRVCLFLPMIFGADAVLHSFGMIGGSSEMTANSNEFMIMSGETTGFIKEIISSFGILTPLIEKFTAYADKLFKLLWNMPLQIVIFIIGLQAIPPHLYEVAKMEGATAWETFWKITFPLLTPSILLCLIYSVIDYFNATTNTIVQMIDENMVNRLDYACTQSWAYSLLIFVIVLVINAIVSRRVISMD